MGERVCRSCGRRLGSEAIPMGGMPPQFTCPDCFADDR